MTIDPRNLSDAEIESAVKEAVKGSIDIAEVVARIRRTFPDDLLSWVWVKEKGAFQWDILLKPYPDAPHYTIICNR